MTQRKLQRVSDYLQHILAAISRIRLYTADTASASELEADFKSRDAVIRNFEIIGEAANQIARVSPAFLALHAEIEWTGIRGMRNKLIHDYLEVDFDLVWRTIQQDLPDLEDKVQAALRGLIDATPNPGQK